MILRRSGVRIGLVWGVLSAATVLGVVFGLGPHMPPGQGTPQAVDQSTTNTLMTALAAPVLILIPCIFIYCVVNFRQRGAQIQDGPPVRGHGPLQLGWVAITTVLVLFLAGYGTYTLLVTSTGAGGGQGPNPVAVPGGDPLQVQVIGQQWDFTYRYPGYGGVETTTLELPRGQMVELHVTSIDVIHSFWAYQLGVKADAVPGTDNIVYVEPTKLGSFQVRCAELCGIWHGNMTSVGYVVSPSAFRSWIEQQQREWAPVTKQLPPYAPAYYPEPVVRGG